MISDSETNFIFFSSILATNNKYAKFWSELKSTLNDNDVNYGLLEQTKDIWCRDYMPIQIAENEFVEYIYQPDYLQTKAKLKWQTNPKLVCTHMGLTTKKFDLKIDGGNVIKYKNSVILTDKILVENQTHYTKEQIIEKLKLYFKVQNILLIPWDIEHEKFGHADGMVRFIDDKTVLVNGYFQHYSNEFKKQFFNEFIKHKIDCKFLTYDVKKEHKNNWAYINFIQTENILLVPKFGIEEDNQALEQIKSCFPEYAKNNRVVQINCSEIIKGGGALNCISWNVYKSKNIPHPTTLYFINDVLKNIDKNKLQNLFDLIPEFEMENFNLIEDKFPRITYNLNIVINFDWNNWNEGNEFFQNPDFNMVNYSFTDLCKLITIFIRYDRFHEGFLYSQICKGNVLKVIQRMRDLM